MSEERELSSVSCPSPSFCAAVDYEGNALTYDGTSWSVPSQVDPGGGLDSVTCPSPSFCAAVDYFGYALSFSNPPAGGSGGAVNGTTPASSGGPPTKPPVERGRPQVNTRTGVITLVYEFPEAGEAREEGRVRAGASLARSRAERSPGLGAAAGANPAALARSAKCRKGYVLRHRRCVSNAPVRYGRAQLAIPTPTTRKLQIKPSARVLAALKRGRKLNVTLTLSFTPAGTSLRIAETAAASVKLKRGKAHHKRATGR